MVEEGSITHISYLRGFSALSHLFFVGDVLIFCCGIRRNIRTILDAFVVYWDIFGQQINNQMSHIYFGESFLARRSEDFIQLLGFQRVKFPFIYLGVSLFKVHQNVLGCNRWQIELNHAL